MVIIDENNICRLIKWESIQTITNTKTMKIKGFPKYTKINKKYGENMFKCNSKHKTWKSKQKHEVCKTKVKMKFYYHDIWNHKHEMKQIKLIMMQYRTLDWCWIN